MGPRWHLTRSPTTPFDALLATALAVSAATSMVAIGPPDPPLRVALGVLVPLGLALRTQLPTTSAAWIGAAVVAESLLTEPPDELAVILSVVISSYSVWAAAPWHRAWRGSAALGVALVTANLFDSSDDLANLAAGVPLFIVVPAWIGFSVRRHHRAADRVREDSERLAAKAATAVDDERRRIARDLHDVVAHAVTLVAVQAEAGQAVFETDAAAARRSLEAIGRASRDALTELDRMLGLLAARDPATGDAPGLDRLSALAAGAEDAGLTLVVRMTGVPGTLTAEADHCAYRVVQEGVTNAMRYADGDTLDVHLCWSDDVLRLEVTSEGHRSSGYGGSGRGLTGLHDRLRAVGGQLDTAAPNSSGYVLAASLPLSHAPEHPS